MASSFSTRSWWVMRAASFFVVGIYSAASCPGRGGVPHPGGLLPWRDWTWSGGTQSEGAADPRPPWSYRPRIFAAGRKRFDSDPGIHPGSRKPGGRIAGGEAHRPQGTRVWIKKVVSPATVILFAQLRLWFFADSGPHQQERQSQPLSPSRMEASMETSPGDASSPRTRDPQGKFPGGGHPALSWRPGCDCVLLVADAICG